LSTFPVHTKETAPSAALPIFEAVEKKYGFVPNLVGVMATSPALAEAYVTLSGILGKTGLTPAEQQIVLLAVSRYNECNYCMAAHSVAADMSKVPAEATDALRADRPLPDPKLEALRHFTTQIVAKRGWIDPEDMQAFTAAGYTPAQAMDVLVGVALKTLSNYTNHIAATPLDAAFQHRAWCAPSAAK
jgi:uncharacterized peroxidase-related enzyme